MPEHGGIIRLCLSAWFSGGSI